MDVKFYHNVPDRLRAALVLTAKAVAAGHKVVVFCPDIALARRYDQELWTAAPQSFVPHVGASSPLAARTPVVIARELAGLPYHDLLLNLADELPAGHEGFALLVEVVAGDEAGRDAARSRWREYRQRGYNVQGFDLGSAA